MLWIGMEKIGCPTCGRDVEKISSVTRKLYGETFYFDTEECANVFDGTGSIFELPEIRGRRGR